jgi:predicted hotdog family 3-hydroxylacyl-ACP dehydratase
VRASNAKTVQKWTEQKAAMGVVAKRIEAERADIERLKQRGGRIGVFLGSLAGRAVDAVVGVLTDRKGKEAARAAALLRAQRTAKAATAVAESEREATKRAELAKDAAAVTARKELRAVAAERDAAQRDVARLTQPAPSQRQQPPSMRM